jgi:hypothetical protein
MAKKHSETIPTHDKDGNLTGSLATSGKNVPAPSAIASNLKESLLRYGGSEEGVKGYNEVYKHFEKAKTTIANETSRGVDSINNNGNYGPTTRMEKTLALFRNIEKEAMRDASDAVIAAEAFHKRLSREGGTGDSALTTAVFVEAREEAENRAYWLSLEYLAAIEARRSFEEEPETTKVSD